MTNEFMPLQNFHPIIRRWFEEGDKRDIHHLRETEKLSIHSAWLLAEKDKRPHFRFGRQFRALTYTGLICEN